MKSPEKKIMSNGKTLTVYYLMPRESIKLLKFMLSTVGGSFSALKGFDFSLDQKVSDIKGDIIASFVEKFVDFDEDQLINWLELILKNVEIDGKKCQFINFQGELIELFEVAKIFLEVNYSDFFGALTGKLSAVFKKVKS